MKFTIVGVILMVAYFGFSIAFIYQGGFEDPRQAMWIGLIGLIVMAVAMMLRALDKRKK